MSDTCPHCGKPVPPSALGGLCPDCMLDVGAAAPTVDATAPVDTHPTPTPSPDTLAPHFPQLEIIECLGRGGMGAVYRARQPKLDRMVALKILLPRSGTGTMAPGFTERFEREARALAQLSHPNIVGVFDFGESGGYPFLVMEYVDGLNLRQMLQEGKMSPEEALAIVPYVCEALQYAHEQGVIHRDIKPENILVNIAGQVKIADFGIAKIVRRQADEMTLTRERDVMGTPHYMAPEQVEQPLNVDHRADIYSLGVVFYEMLTGELPLGRFAPPSRKVNVDVRLDEIVLHTLEKEPARRYQHAGDVKTDVASIASSPAATPPPVGSESLGKRTSLLIFGLVVSVIGLPFGVGMGLPLVIGLSVAGIIVSLLKLSGRLAMPSPLFGEAYPGLRAAEPHVTREFSGLQMAILAIGCACCVTGISFGLGMGDWLLSPVLIVLGVTGIATIVPAMVLGRKILTGRQGAARHPSAPPPVSAARRPGRGPLYWILTMLLAGFGILLVLALGTTLLSLAVPALQRARRASSPPVQVIETAPAAAELGKPLWGPVYETTLPGGSLDAMRFLDLDKGEAHAAAEFFVPGIDLGMEENLAWGRETGIDLFLNMETPGVLRSPGVLVGVELVAVPVSSAAWENLGADLPLHVQSVVPDDITMLPYQPDESETFAFRTREGALGLLRVTGMNLTPEQPSITVQYRLAASPAEAGLEMVAPTATPPTTPVEKAPQSGPDKNQPPRRTLAESETLADMGMLQTALELYALDTGAYPSAGQGLEALVKDPGVEGWHGPYVKAGEDVFSDPWGNGYVYSVRNDRFSLLSTGRDQRLHTKDDLLWHKP